MRGVLSKAICEMNAWAVLGGFFSLAPPLYWAVTSLYVAKGFTTFLNTPRAPGEEGEALWLSLSLWEMGNQMGFLPPA